MTSLKQFSTSPNSNETIPYQQVTTLSYDQFMRICSFIYASPKHYPIDLEELYKMAKCPGEQVEKVLYTLLLCQKIKIKQIKGDAPNERLVFYPLGSDVEVVSVWGGAKSVL